MTVTVAASNNTITLATANTPTNCTANNGTATVTPSGGQSPYTYSWSPSGQTNATATGLSAGSYTVTVTDANGCTQTATVVVTQNNNNLTCNINTPSPICSGSTANLSASVSGGQGPYSYSWVPGSQTSSAITVSPTTTTSYNCIVTDANGCTTVQTVTVNVDPPITAAVNGLNTICVGASTIITVTAGGGTSPFSYSWIPSGGTASSVSVSPTTSTTYSVIITDAQGCTFTSTGVTINVSPTPVAAFSATPSSTTPNTPVNFTDLSTINVGSISCWSWTFGDGSPVSVLQNPTHTYAMPGTYNVCLIICGQACPDTICYNYEVQPTEVIAPNVITPNGDGKNDTLVFRNLEYFPNSVLRIYNRWGSLVYDSPNYQNDWTGGKVSDGTYYYVLYITEKQEEQKGFVEVLRH
jgi:gliding motility-associated-like protein